MTDKTQSQPIRIYRDRVLKCITDKPGSVVYRDDIAQQTDLTEDQVMGCMGSFLRESNNPLSKDIEVVVSGRAWRYVPNPRVRRAVNAVTGSGNARIARAIEEGRPLPLTYRIREYFAANERRVVYLDELHHAMNIPEAPVTEDQVRVGISNARMNHPTFRKQLSIVTAGKAWMFTSNDTTAANEPSGTDVAPALPSTTTAPASSPSPVSSPSPKSDVDEQMLLLEYLGKTDDGGGLYRDENKNLYRVKRL